MFCVSSIRRFLREHNAGIYIWEDANSPITEPSRRKLLRLGCKINPTFYPRCGNLIGESCFLGMMGNYLESHGETNAQYIAKIDPDILILNSNLESFLGQSKALFAIARHGDPYGGMYLMESSIVYLFEKIASGKFDLSRLKKQKKFSVLEDYSFWTLAKLHFGEKSVPSGKKEEYWTGNTEKPDCKNNLALNCGVRKISPEECAEKMRYISRRFA